MPKAIPTPQPNGHHSTPANGNGKLPTPSDAARALGDSGPGAPLDGMNSRWNGSGAEFTDPSGAEVPAVASLEAVFRGAEAPDPAEMERLVAENSQLREIIAELRQGVDEATSKREGNWAEQQKEYESLLEEKSELIRNLHLKIQELEGQKVPAPVTPKEEELLALNQELEGERCRIEQERRQLDEDLKQFKDDEQIMVQQMREMELQMARERAELARQRNELQRIMDEIRHEIDRVERDRGLNERLTQLRHRYNDVSKGRVAPPPAPEAPAAQPQAPPEERQQARDSGFFRRLFG